MAYKQYLNIVRLILFLACTTFFIGNAKAANLFWNCADGSVTDITCWNPQQLPAAIDYLYVNNAGIANITSGDALVSSRNYIGYASGAGTLVQDGGNNTVANLFTAYIANNTGTSNGLYQLSGTGNLHVTTNEYLGYLYSSSVVVPQANASFVQDGGSHVVDGTFYHGYIYQTYPHASSVNVITSDYSLNSGSLTVHSNEYLGDRDGSY